MIAGFDGGRANDFKTSSNRAVVKVSDCITSLMAIPLCFQLFIVLCFNLHVTSTQKGLPERSFNLEDVPRQEFQDLNSYGGTDFMEYPGIDKRVWQKSSLKAWGKRNEEMSGDQELGRMDGGDEKDSEISSKNKWQNFIRAWGKKNNNAFENSEFDGEEDDLATNDLKDGRDKKILEEKRSGWKKNRLKIWGKRSIDDGLVESIDDYSMRSLGPDHVEIVRRPLNFGDPKRNWQNNILRLWG